jgi:hypothetical protein
MANLPDRDGTYRAYPKEWGVNFTEKNQLAMFVVRYSLSQLWHGGEWCDYRDYDAEITGYHMLEKRDHTANDTTIEQLRKALGWDGVDLCKLQDTDWSATCVKITVATEEYEGKKRMTVKWIASLNDEGGMTRKADKDSLRELQNRLGSSLRALAGAAASGKGAVAHTPPPPPTAAAATPPAPPQKPAATKETAWEAFRRLMPGQSEEAISAEWWRRLESRLAGRQESEMTEEDWKWMATSAIPI